jgi:glucose-6-phosphate dehydrogenase assembly protein OpcA
LTLQRYFPIYDSRLTIDEVVMETELQSKRDEARSVRGVDVAGLEKQLAAMWRQSASEEGARKSGVTRVCVVNLIVFMPRGAQRAALDELLEEVAAQTPSRVLVLFVDREAEARLDAYVSSRCRVALKGRRQVCGEQVTIEACGAAVETVASAVEPLLVPDIPAFLWWKDIPHEDDKLFMRLVEMSDRVVIDSAAFDHPHDDLRRVAQLVESRADVMLLSDLNWGRLTTWRNLVAGFWDVPEYRAHLDALDDVCIDYEPSAVAPEEIAAQALLVAGWLASCLGWQTSAGFARDENCYRTTLNKGEREINLELRPVEGRACGAIKRIAFRGGAAEFYARADEGGTKLETLARIGDALRVGRVLAYEARTEGQRLSRELSIFMRDEVYEKSVASAARLLTPHASGG